MNYINKIITESFKQLLTEGAIDNYIKKLIQDNASDYLKPYLNTHVTQINNSQLVQTLKEGNRSVFEQCANNPNMGTLTHYLRMDFLHYFDINRGKGPTEFLHGIARIAIGELGFCNDNRDEGYMSLFKQNVMFVHDNPQLVNIQFDKDLNKLGFDDFVNIVNKIRREFNEQNRINLKSDMINKDYEIVPIMDEEQAQQYAPYVRWCVTRDAYHSYAKGGSRFYFCLRKGFENVHEEPDENCPLDEYGLSMIAVLVDMDGEPVHITTRWNHEYDGEDNPNLRTAEQFQKLLGIDFYSTFIPYTSEELRAMGITPFYEVQDMLNNGVDPKEIFNSMSCSNLDGVFKVKLNDRYNFYDSSNNKLLCKKWFDYVDRFNEGLVRVRLGDKYNFIKINGDIAFPNQWYDAVESFSDGLAQVKLGDKYNFINTNGDELTPNQWYDKVGSFYNGLAWAKLGSKFRIIKTNDKIAFSNQWYDEVGKFSDGLVKVRIGRKYNFLKTNGDILTPNQWYNHVHDFKNGFATVMLDHKWNFLKTNGEELTPNQWYDTVSAFKDGFVKVELDGEYLYLDTEGNLWDKARTQIIQPANTVNEMRIIKNNFHNLFERINKTW